MHSSNSPGAKVTYVLIFCTIKKHCKIGVFKQEHDYTDSAMNLVILNEYLFFLPWHLFFKIHNQHYFSMLHHTSSVMLVTLQQYEIQT